MINEEFQKQNSTPSLLQNIWDDHYWNDPTCDVIRMRSALVAKHLQLEELKLAATKEVISDLPIGGLALTSTVLPIVAAAAHIMSGNFASGAMELRDLQSAVMPALGLKFGLDIAAKLSRDYKGAREDFDTLIETLANFRNNSEQHGHEEAERLLNLNLAEQNIKLSGVPLVEKDEFDKYATKFLMEAQKMGHLTPPQVTAYSAELAGESLAPIAKDHGKSIGNNLQKPLRTALFIWTAFTESIKDLAKISPISKSVYGAGKALISDYRADKETSENRAKTRESAKRSISYIEKHSTNPKVKSEMIKANVNLTDVWKYKKTLETVDKIKEKSPQDKKSFLLATGLMAVSATGVAAGAYDLISDPQSFNIAQQLTLFANAFGFLGLGPLKETADLVKHNHDALHDEQAKEAEKHTALTDNYENLLAIAEKVKRDDRNKQGFHNMRLRNSIVRPSTIVPNQQDHNHNTPD